MDGKKTELERRDVLRLSNEESNKISRECISLALIYLLKSKDLSKITITELVTRAGVSRATFYRNYSSKEDVLAEIENTIFSRLENFYSEMFETDRYEWCLSVFREFEKNAEIIKLLLSTCMNFFAAGIFTNPIAQTARDKPDHYRISAIKGAVLAVALEWIAAGMRETPEELAALCSKLKF